MEEEYKIIKQLRKDNLGTEYLIEKNNEQYTLKQINLKLKEDELKQFKNIINDLSKINNGNIVKYFDIFMKNDILNILMECTGDYDLKQFIQNYKNKDELINENLIRNIILQICIGLKALHENNIIHGDLSLDNIFIDKNNKIKLVNYIIPKLIEILNNDERSVLLKTHYFSQEIKEDSEYNKKVDIYSLGCLIYELFTLNEYNEKDKKIINKDIYNSKYQELIDLLLKKDFHERPNIGEIINIIKLIPDKLEQNENKNYILAEININEEDVNKDIRIINSFEECKRKGNITVFKKHHNEYKNEKEIKSCKIKINNNFIDFNYFYKFKEKGKYTIEYIFSNNITKTNFMFYLCTSLTNINLSNFNTQNVTNMSYMFHGCASLQNVNFENCNTQNVTDMSQMFFLCTSLTNLNLSNFNTKNVTDMSYMFDGCESLQNINLLNFDTQNVTDMGWMFSGCEKLKDLNLSNFNTKKVTNMTSMFEQCISLTNLNLLNFSTQNDTEMSLMFEECKLLNEKNIITHDKNILEEFKFNI